MLQTPYDEVIDHVIAEGYHNHRREDHSDLISDGLVADLLQTCDALRRDVEEGVVKYWVNVRAPGGRNRFLDLFIGEPDPVTGAADFRGLRIGVEHKSVLTAHRNKTNRYDDLMRTLNAIHPDRPQAVLAATVLVGTAPRVLNIPDQVHKVRQADFETAILPRLSRGDHGLWEEFAWAISRNRADDPEKTIALFRSIPTRNPGHTHEFGYDCLQIVPVFIDNVESPRVERDNPFGLDVEAEYRQLLHVLCAAYTARWHLR
ncbi:MAG: hypothetical protein ABIO70_02090 [Pseudomonadota bacterium]